MLIFLSPMRKYTYSHNEAEDNRLWPSRGTSVLITAPQVCHCGSVASAPHFICTPRELFVFSRFTLTPAALILDCAALQLCQDVRRTVVIIIIFSQTLPIPISLAPRPVIMSHQITVIEPRMAQKPPFTVEVPGSSPVPGETIPRRNIKSPNKLVSSPEEGIFTVYDIVKRSASKYGDLKAVGSRKLLKTHHEIKKVKKLIDGQVQEVDKNWTYFELSGYSYITFKEYEVLTHQIGAGLRKLGLVKQDRVHMFAATRYGSLLSMRSAENWC